MSIVVKDATVIISEQTVKELVCAMEKAREEIEFTDEPMPDGDMDIENYKRLKAKRGEILVSSYYDNTTFAINLETTSHTQESQGYKLYDYKFGDVKVEAKSEGKDLTKRNDFE